MAFLRYFPGQEALNPSFGKSFLETGHTEESDRIRSDSRYFSRLTLLASWRSEYLLRTRLLRSIARGKPGTNNGNIGSSSRTIQSGRRASAVLTYNSKLPWMVSNIHAVFSNGKKGPKVIHGTSDFCVSTASDPSTGKVEKWGLDDPFSFMQLDEVFPQLEPYGVADGPAAVPNVMDVSLPYGMVGGEGFPGGRPYWRAINELRGRYLGQESAIIDMNPEVPKIPELSEAICSIWVAKSPAVPSLTQNMVGIVTGSTLGVVTTYALGDAAAGRRYKNGDMTARWVLSPGVPIIAIKIDDSYNQRRKSAGRVWACALNALGECFVLSATPTPLDDKIQDKDSTRNAWMAGRSVYWELIESTRRQARPDEFDKNAVRGAYSPRSPSDAMNLSKEQIVAEARETEKFLRHDPSHFRKVCEGWDMRRKLEVDFAGGDVSGAGEAIFVVCCGHDKGEPVDIRRHTRHNFNESEETKAVGLPAVFSDVTPSIFGSGSQTPQTTTPSTGLASDHPQRADSVSLSEWRTVRFAVKNLGQGHITATTMDSTTFALLSHAEDPLNFGGRSTKTDAEDTPTSKRSTGEIPGRRSRLFAIGTDNGKVVLWNARETATTQVDPVRVIQTESPEITCLAMSALYLVHGGSDGLVQAWDPLASETGPIRTLSSRSSGRVPRHVLNANPALRNANYSACTAIFLDHDPSVLRGILCFGTFLRYWTYSSTGQPAGRKRRTRNSDIHGRLASRRNGSVRGYIAAEEAELRHEQEHLNREQTRLRNRFGVGFSDLTEEEAIRYAQMISEESHQLDEQRRTSASDTGSTADIGETASSSGSLDTITPDPSLSGFSSSVAIPSSAGPSKTADDEDDYEQQIQRAIRLSLMEGVNDMGQSPRASSSTDFDFQVKYKPQKGKRSTSVSRDASQAHTPLPQYSQPSHRTLGVADAPEIGQDVDDDLALALRLSLEEEEKHKQTQDVGQGIEEDAFPTLEPQGKGKGVSRY